MPDTLKRLYGPALLTNAAATKYTAPAATKAVLRTIHVANTSASPATLFLSIGADAAGTRLFSGQSIPANGSLDWSGNVTLEAAEIVQAYSGTTNVLSLVISGLEIS